MPYRCICGVDPGLTGAIAFYFPEADAISVRDMPVVAGDVDAATLAAILRQMQPEIAVVEQVASRPKQGVASVFKFGSGYGMVQGVLAAIEIPRHLVTPQRWKKHHRLDAEKESARALALKLWPARSELFGLKKHAGRAEAALIARYGAAMIP